MDANNSGNHSGEDVVGAYGESSSMDMDQGDKDVNVVLDDVVVKELDGRSIDYADR